MKKPRKPDPDNVDPLRISGTKAESNKQQYTRKSYQRGHHLEWLHNRKLISDVQYMAGCRVRAVFSEAHGQIKSLDILNDRVDGGGKAFDIRGSTLVEAKLRLDRLAAKLGKDQLFVLVGIAGIGMSLPDVASYFVEPNQVVPLDKVDRPAKDYCARLLKSALSHAAAEFGMVARGKGKAGLIRSATSDHG
ncbi:hypothetical protein AB1P65_13555 [Roseibium alexandrii]